MTTTTVTLKIDVNDDGYHQTTTRKVEVFSLELEQIHKILESTADDLRLQSKLPLDAGAADPSHVTTLRPVPDGDEQDVVDEHDADSDEPWECPCTDAGVDPECPIHIDDEGPDAS